MKYDSPHEDLPSNYCNFHIFNAVSPKSIFDDPDYLPNRFLELMDRSEKEHGYDTLHTGTWLNDYPRWLQLFPREWHDNLGPRENDIRWHLGFWGQMVTARGTFNHKTGAYLRECGVMKYCLRTSHCSFVNMREKILNELKGE